VRQWIAFLLIILALGPQASRAMAQTALEVRIRWDAYVGAPAPQVQPRSAQPSSLFTLLERRHVPGAPPRHRNPELSPDQILVVAVDQQGQEIFWNLIPDPRVLRSEGPGPSGEMRGEVLHHATAEFLITLPDDPVIAELRLYHPRWTGTDFALDLLGTVPVR